MIHVHFAKEYFVRAMRSTDSDSDCSNDLTNVYMAVLCYITGQYQKATDHCTLATKFRTYTCMLRSSRVVNGEFLPKIDDNIDTVLGLAVLYQYVRTTALEHGQHAQHVSVFTAVLFAHYFNIRHLLVAQCCLPPKTKIQHALQKVQFRLNEELNLLLTRIALAPGLFVTDLMLLMFSNNFDQLSSSVVISSHSCNRQRLVQWLTHMPIQQMIRYRQSVFPQDVDSQFVAAVKSSVFTALRLYRCKLYERCTELCQRAVYEMINGHVCPVARLCFFYRDFVQLMDDDVVSLVGMTVLVNKTAIQPKLKLNKFLNISELTMSLYLLTRCQMNVLSSAERMPDISTLIDVLDLIADAEKLTSSNNVLDYLILKLSERLSVMYIIKRLYVGPKKSLFRTSKDDMPGALDELFREEG